MTSSRRWLCEAGWPDTGRIVVEKYPADFAVEAVGLLGRPGRKGGGR